MGKKLKCIKCNDIIESKFRHDYVKCSCGAIFVDGGDDYLKYGGDFNSILFDYNNSWLSYDEVSTQTIKNELPKTFWANGKDRVRQAKKEIIAILSRYDCKLKPKNMQTVGLVTEDYVVNQIIQEMIDI